MEDKNKNKKQKSGFEKKLEKLAALLSAAGSDSKQRKLNFTVTSFKKKQHENVSEISNLSRVIEKSSNNSDEILSELTPEFPTKMSNIIYPSESLPIKVLSHQDESNVTINKNDMVSSSESESDQNSMDEVIESNTNISLFIPPLFSSHHQKKVAFVDAHPCQPQSNVPFASNKVYFRKMPDGKYVN